MTDASSVPATLIAGVSAGMARSAALFRRARFPSGDPMAVVEINGTSTLIIRDIELDRARTQARADRVICPADAAPPQGKLSGDREIATAQAAAELFRRAGVSHVSVHRHTPAIYLSVLEQAGIRCRCDPEMGARAQRSKDAQEVAWLREAQRVTEQAVEFACRLIARADAGPGGVLIHQGAPLTTERVRAAFDVWLLERGFLSDDSIVAGGSFGGDCHDHGRGPLRTGEPVIVDIYPRARGSQYCGDCTRTVVHGTPTPELVRMHRAVVEAKAAAIAAVRPGATGAQVHAETMRVLRAHGFDRALPSPDRPPTFISIQHGTGHGVGLDVHEPPLLDDQGVELVVGDALTIEPGLYSRAFGGVRVEDLVIVTPHGCDNLNSIPEGLDWK